MTHHAKPRKIHTTNSQLGFGRYPNLVEHLVVERPDQVWVADVTYIRLRKEFVAPFCFDGWVYALDPEVASGTDVGAGVNFDGTPSRFGGFLS